MPVIGKNDPFPVPLPFGVVAVALGELPALRLGERSFVVAVVVAADALSRRVFAQVQAAFPPQGLRFLLRDEVVRQVPVGEDVVRDGLRLDDRAGRLFRRRRRRFRRLRRLRRLGRLRGLRRLRRLGGRLRRRRER